MRRRESAKIVRFVESKHWLFSVSDTTKRMYFVVLLPNGMVVEPKFAERL
jgi:hypothetical protein